MLSIYVSQNGEEQQCQVLRYTLKGGIVNCSKVETTTVKRAKSLIGGNLARVSVQTDKLAIEKVEIPAVKNDRARAPIIKRKLAGVPDIADSLFVSSKDAEQSSVKKGIYGAYIVPRDSFQRVLQLNSKSVENVDMYTIDVLGLFAISRTVDSSDYVFNAYADDARLYMVLSTGNVITYARMVDIPEDVKFDEDIENFFYENLNLTYLHLVSTYNDKKIETILTGRLQYFSSLHERLSSFLSAHVIELDVDSIARNISRESFHKYMIPIGVALLEATFDYSSPIQQGDRVMRKVFTVANLVLFLAMCATGYYAAVNYEASVRADATLEEKSVKSFDGKIQVIKEVGDPKVFAHYTNSVNLVGEKYGTAVQLVPIVQDMLALVKLGTVKFEGIGSESKVTIKGDVQQKDFNSLNEFELAIQELVKNAGEYDVTVSDTSLHTFKDIKNSVNIVITLKK